MKILVCFLCAALLLSASLLAATAPGALSYPDIMSQRALNINNWSIACTNYGPFVNPGGGNPGGYWGGPTYNYIYGAGLWVGGIIGGDLAVAVGYNPNSGQHEMGPANPYTWDFSNYSTDSLSRLYLSTDPNDLAAWPLRDSLNNPIIISAQDGFTAVSDENPAFTFSGEQRLNIRYYQQSFAWNYAGAGDLVIFYFSLINPNPDTLRRVYAGPCVDADIGNESGTNANDLTSFDYARNLTFQYQTTPESGWPVTGVVGCRFFESPVNNYYDTVWVVDNQYPHGVAPGQQLGLTAMKIFTIDVDPATDSDRYLVLQGYDYNTMVMDAYDETGDDAPGDKRFVMVSGPFDLAPGDTATLCVGVMAALDTTILKILSDSAQSVYNTYVGVGGAPPAVAPVRELKAQCLPNPFRRTATIRYQVARPGPASLEVYNVAGQLVRTLVRADLQAGRHSASWDGRDESGRAVSAGIYLYRLRAGGGTLAGKMVLVR